MAYLDLSYDRLGFHISCDADSYRSQRLGRISSHSLRWWCRPSNTYNMYTLEKQMRETVIPCWPDHNRFALFLKQETSKIIKRDRKIPTITHFYQADQIMHFFLTNSLGNKLNKIWRTWGGVRSFFSRVCDLRKGIAWNRWSQLWTINNQFSIGLIFITFSRIVTYSANGLYSPLFRVHKNKSYQFQSIVQ